MWRKVAESGAEEAAMLVQQHGRNIRGVRIARSADRAAVMGGPRIQCARGGWLRTTAPVQVNDRKAPPPLFVEKRRARGEDRRRAGPDPSQIRFQSESDPVFRVPYLSSRTAREARTDEGPRGAWPCGRGAAAWGRDVRTERGGAGPMGRRGWVIHTRLSRLW